MRKIESLFGEIKNIVKTGIAILDGDGELVQTNDIFHEDIVVDCEGLPLHQIETCGSLYCYKFLWNLDEAYTFVADNKIGQPMFAVMTLLFSKKERQSKEDVFKDLLLGKETEEKYKHDCEGLVPAWIHLFTLEDAVDGAIEFFQQFFDDTIINVEDNQLVLFSKEKLPIEDLRNISDSIQTELLTKASISRGSYAETVDELPLSYENAIRTHKAGLRIGKADNVFVYEELVGPLMVQLLDKKDIGELTFAIKKLWIDNLNDELVGTAKAFFENNLNITDTANKLFIHRNTLIYRINKIQKITGYDIRKFEHGINLYILLLCESL